MVWVEQPCFTDQVPQLDRAEKIEAMIFFASRLVLDSFRCAVYFETLSNTLHATTSEGNRDASLAAAIDVIAGYTKDNIAFHLGCQTSSLKFIYGAIV